MEIISTNNYNFASTTFHDFSSSHEVNDVDQSVKNNKLPPWKILVVDDELDVHKVTKLVLSDFVFSDRCIEIISAFTGEQAKDILRESKDIAVILLDVVMEEYDTGLRLVEFIRNDLNNNYARIILRTGQPGQAPERDVILQYDINDYKSKTELTADKLITSVVSCLRSFVDIVTIDKNRRGLERIVISTDNIFNKRTFEEFVQSAIEQVSEIIKSESTNVFCRNIMFAGMNNDDFVLKNIIGESYKDKIGQRMDSFLGVNAIECVRLSVAQKMNVYRDSFFAGFIGTSNGLQHLVMVEKNSIFDEWEKDLLDIFLANVATAMENIYLNIELESKVDERTKELSEAKHELEVINDRLTETITLLEQAHHVAESDMRMAVNVQSNILPNTVPKSDMWDLAYSFKPMTGISGDYYDFYQNDTGDLTGVSIFDVSGHGIASGLITMLAKSITYRRFKAMDDRSVGEILDAINDDLIAELDNVPNFLSGLMLRFKGNEIEYSNAGHPDMIIKDNGGNVYSFNEKDNNHKGFYLGLKTMQDRHPSSTFSIEKNNVILIFTDGLIESTSPDNKPYGNTRLKEVLAGFDRQMSAGQILDGILNDFEQYTQTSILSDDTTVIVLKRK